MQKVELYIGDVLVDFFDDESITLKQTIKDIKDPGRVFTDYSQSFTVPASKINNKIFKHYHRVDVLNGYDARIRKRAEIRINGSEFRKGYVVLTKVKTPNNVATHYNIQFTGDTVSLKDIIGDDNLSDLNWLDKFDLTYGGSSVETALKDGIDVTILGDQATPDVLYQDAIVSPMITHTKFLYYDSIDNLSGTDGNLYNNSGNTTHGLEWSDLKYSIKARIIIKAIEEKYGFNFSTDFFSQTNGVYDELYMWLHRKQGPVGEENTGSSPKITTTLSNMPNVTIVGTDLNKSNIIQTGIGTISTSADIFFTIKVSNSSAEFDFQVIDSGGAVVKSSTGLTGATSYNITSFETTNNETYRVQIKSSDTFSILSTSTIRVVTYNIQDETPYDVTSNFSSSQLLAQDIQFKITENVPQMKVMDFLNGLFKMFNLTIFRGETTRDFTVKTLDSYYSNPTVFDITKYVDIKDTTIGSMIPYNVVKFTNSDHKTYTASLSEQLNGHPFGELEYKGEDTGQWIGSSYEISIPFQKMRYNRISNLATQIKIDAQFGWFANADQKPYKGKPLLHYVERIANGDAIAWSKASGVFNNLTTYHVPLNSRNLVATQQSLNFKAETDEYAGIQNSVTLFETYHRNTYEHLFAKNQRLVSVTAHLPLSIMLQYSLADIFVIGDVRYKINSISTNLTSGKSKLELLNEI